MKHLRITLITLTFCSMLLSQQKPIEIEVCSELKLIKISETIYIHESYIHFKNSRVASNGMLIIENGKAFLFDTPPNDSITKILLAYIQTTLKCKIEGFVTNDWHIDSMGGLAEINSSGIPSYASELTRQIAKSKGLPVPKIGFTDSSALKMGSKTIFCYFPGAGHTMDNCVVWIPSEKVLFADCLVKEIAATDLGFTGDGDLKAYSKTLENVKVKFPDAQIVIPGHGLFGGIELIEHTLKMAQNK